jgi:cytochrome c biogenesis protein CcdA
MLDFIKLPLSKGNDRLNKLQEKFAAKGYLGSFLLGAVFALAFCPFSGVLFFGMLIPLALKAGDGLIIPSIFAFATGLPVIIFSFVLVYSVSKLSSILNKVQLFEKWMRRIVGVVFILMGVYYIFNFCI